MNRHYMLKMTHIEDNVYLEERVYLKSLPIEDAINEFREYAERNGFDVFIPSTAPLQGAYTQSVNPRNKLRLRLSG